jgi:hypothetical protein
MSWVYISPLWHKLLVVASGDTVLRSHSDNTWRNAMSLVYISPCGWLLSESQRCRLESILIYTWRNACLAQAAGSSRSAAPL